MKKIIFTLLLLVLVLPSFAQRDNLLEDGRRWVTFFCGLYDTDTSESLMRTVIIYNGGYCSFRNITINGDTIINGIKYKKLYASDDECETNDMNIPGKLSAFLRYDNGRYLYRFFNNNKISGENLLFDENCVVGDTIVPKQEVVISVSDTINNCYSDNLCKYWKVKDISNGSNFYYYFKYFDDIKWIQGIGHPTTLLQYERRGGYDCLCSDIVLFCIAANGDTIYRNKRYWFPDLVQITKIRKISADEVSFTQQGNECIVTLPLDAAWSATLSNSVGVTVARRSGEGSEIILPATSKGTHILVVKAGGRVVKKKVFIK